MSRDRYPSYVPGLEQACHDLRTPLTAIRGHAQLLLRIVNRTNPVEAHRLRAGLALIEAATREMAERIDRLDGHGRDRS